MRAIIPRPVLALAVFVSTLGAAPLTFGADAGALPTEYDAECSNFAMVPGLGPSCRVAGGWRVLLDDGSTVLTHGFDYEDAEEPLVAGAPSIQPKCVDDPAAQYHNLIIYARPHDRADRYATRVPQLRDLAAAVNGVLLEEAGEFGMNAQYVFACDPDGALTVKNAVLPTDAAADSFSTIVGDLKRQGYTSTLAKYWIMYDDGVSCGCSGTGTVANDDRLIEANRNNVGPSWAVTYGLLQNTFMHESGHNLGAVQVTSPHSSGGWHCNDGSDVMCYSDGGAKSDYRTVCYDRRHFDCNHDDYYNPYPEPGSYLATHWNLASPLNRFIRAGDSRAPEMDLFFCSPPPRLTGRPVVCTMTSRDDSLQVGYDVDWGDGSPVERLPLQGFVTPATAASRAHAFTAGTYVITATPFDSAGHVGAPAATTVHVACDFDARAEGVRTRLTGPFADSGFALAPSHAHGAGRSSMVAEVLIHETGTVGTRGITTSAGGSATPPASTASATVAKVTILGGLITVTDVSTEATTDASGSSADSRFGTLTVAGIPVVASSGAQRITLGSFGYAILNDREVTSGAASSTADATAIRIVLDNALLTGEIVIGKSTATTSCGPRADAYLDPGDDDAASGGDASDDPVHAVPLASPAHVKGRLLEADMVDHYAVYAAPGFKVSATLAPASRFSPTLTAGSPVARLSAGTPNFDLRLLEPGTFIERESSALLASAPERVELNVDKAGMWVLEVSRAGPTPGNYSLTTVVTPITFAPEDEAADGGDAPEFCGDTTAAYKETMVGRLDEDDAADVYRIPALRGETVVVTMVMDSADGADFDLILYDLDCNVLDTSSQGKDTLWAGLVPKGVPETVARSPLDDNGLWLKIVRENGIGSYVARAEVHRLD